MTVTTYRIERDDGTVIETTAPGLAEYYSRVLGARVTARTEAFAHVV